MTLRPCPACARHVRADGVACVFCRAPLAATPIPERRIAGRTSRAVIFAGALAIAPLGCGPSVHYEPLPADLAQAARIRGRVVRHDGRPAAYVVLSIFGDHLRAIDGNDARTAQADANGVYVFDNVPPGRYRLAISGLAEALHFDVRKGQAAVIEVELDKPKPVDPRHMAKPYGAPPARRRIV